MGRAALFPQSLRVLAHPPHQFELVLRIHRDVNLALLGGVATIHAEALRRHPERGRAVLAQRRQPPDAVFLLVELLADLPQPAAGPEVGVADLLNRVALAVLLAEGEPLRPLADQQYVALALHLHDRPRRGDRILDVADRRDRPGPLTGV